jgi:hypothetical protein
VLARRSQIHAVEPASASERKIRENGDHFEPDFDSQLEPTVGGRRTATRTTAAACKAIENKAAATVEAAVKAAEEAPLPSPEECLDDVYVTYSKTA